MEKQVDDDYEEQDSGGKGGGILIALIALIFLLPAFIIGGVFYSLIRFFRLRPSLINVLVIIWEALMVFFWFILDATDSLVFGVKNILNIANIWEVLVTPLLLINGAVGGIIGIFLVFWTVRQMEENPHRFETRGNWMYKFKYRRTPWELMNKKKIIKSLRNGAYCSEEKAPLGLIEEGDYRPGFRYYDEANKHSIIVGNSGSGKPLHKNTLVPTTKGFKTIKELDTKDIVYNNYGLPIKIIEKYHPYVKKAYKITTSNHEEIIAGAEHLWKVYDDKNKNNSLEEIYNEIETLNNEIENTVNIKPLDYKTFNKTYPTISKIIDKNKINNSDYDLLSKDKILKNLSKYRNQFEELYVNEVTKFIENYDYPTLYRRLIVDNYKHDKLELLLTNSIHEENKTLSHLEFLDYSIKEAKHYVSVKQHLKTVSTQTIYEEYIENKKLYLPLVTSPIEFSDNVIVEPKDFSKKLYDAFNTGDNVPKLVHELLYSSIESRKSVLSHILEKFNIKIDDLKSTNVVSHSNSFVINSLKALLISLGFSTKLLVDNDNFVLTFSNDPLNPIRNEIIKVEPIECEHDEFYCITVDDESHMFLITESFIPTRNTITMQNLMINDIRMLKPLVIIDMKRSPEFASKIAKWAYDEGANFYHFVNGDPIDYDIKYSPGQSYYDPLSSGTATSKADMVLGMREYDTASAVYKSSMQQLLQVLFNMFDEADREHPALFSLEYKAVKEPDIVDGVWTVKPMPESKHVILSDSSGRAAFLSRPSVKKFLKDKLVPSPEGGVPVYKMNVTDRKSETDPVKLLFALGCFDRVKVSKINWDSGGIYQVASAIRGNNLMDLAKACEGKPHYNEAMEIAQAAIDDKNINHSVKELRGQMRTIIASEYGPWLSSGNDNDRNIDLFKLTKDKGNVILFSLNSDSEPEFAKYVGSMIMSDLTATSAKRRNRQLKNQVMVYIDEFQAINPTSVAGLLEKSRESAIAVTLAQQSFEQIVASAGNNGEAYLTSILDTCSNFIIHAGMTHDSAERISKILGKHKVTKYRVGRVGNKSNSFFLGSNWRNRRNQTIQTDQEESWKFGPEKVMKLSSPTSNNKFKSTAVVVNKSCSDPVDYQSDGGATGRVMWMIPDNDVLKNYYDPEYRNVNDKRELVSNDERLELEAPIHNDEYVEDEDYDNDPLPNNYENDIEESESYDEDYDDGGFHYEETDEIEEDVLEIDIEDLNIDSSEIETKQEFSMDSYNAKKSVDEVSTATKMFRQAKQKKTEPLVDNKTTSPKVSKAKKKDETPDGVGSSVRKRKSGGLPIPKNINIGKNRPINNDDDISLPDLF